MKWVVDLFRRPHTVDLTPLFPAKEIQMGTNVEVGGINLKPWDSVSVADILLHPRHRRKKH